MTKEIEATAILPSYRIGDTGRIAIYNHRKSLRTMCDSVRSFFYSNIATPVFMCDSGSRT